MSVVQETGDWLMRRGVDWYCRIFGHKLCFEDGRRATEREVMDTYVDEELICSTCKRFSDDTDEVFVWGIIPYLPYWING
ncbi:MAG TPA: hypothetical protein VK604_14945 [Bryobacteraceae bacterium]|nr:hypothetical protein [Bryobacteraceae bacterium]HTF72558.1 hypothetical protein [Edaphobacter sp.]